MIDLDSLTHWGVRARALRNATGMKERLKKHIFGTCYLPSGRTSRVFTVTSPQPGELLHITWAPKNHDGECHPRSTSPVFSNCLIGPSNPMVVGRRETKGLPTEEGANNSAWQLHTGRITGAPSAHRKPNTRSNLAISTRLLMLRQTTAGQKRDAPRDRA